MVLKRAKGLCGICQRPLNRKWTIDHIIPLSRGGTHEYANIQPAHPFCNRLKADLLPTEFDGAIALPGFKQKPKYRNRAKLPRNK